MWEGVIKGEGNFYLYFPVYLFLLEKETMAKVTNLISFGVFQKTHFVGEILIETLKKENISGSWKGRLIRIGEISEEIEPEVSLSRYPAIREDLLQYWFGEGEG